jgi:formylglycine-generating enzyme required for sulfatase activity
MTETPDRTESVFAAAVVLETLEERAAYLDQACAGDPALRERIDALLRAHDGVVDLLDRLVPAGQEQTAAYLPSEQPGTVVAGRYKLLEEIGEGGMGTVWVAEQTQPVRRKVALKLIKAGMDSKSVLARFEAERQALAVMDHPNIAKVLDGGLTETGRPFFVMEYVKGVPITEYCEATRLSVPERLQLFVQVCQAVQHAHQKGIIHRDLKPSNILVAPYDDRAVPKVIDFGLAKAMHQPLTERTLHTAHDAVLGTPVYMSPEQAQLNNLDVDTRSDLYSLGVLLYELLTGTTPLEKQRFKEAAWDEVRRIIREEEPPRPSMRLSSSQTLPALAAARQTEPAQLTKLVRGELDWIVMKALEKDRTRRYETASGFALDVQRYLAGEPVLAVPPSAGYRLRKFARKHQAGLMTAAAMIVLFLAGAAFSTWQAVRATRALHQLVAAQRERALAQVNTLRSAEISHVPYLIEDLKPFRAETDPQLRQLLQQPDLGEKERLRLTLAIVAEDEAQVAYLYDRLLDAEPSEVPVIRGALAPYKDSFLEKLWAVVEAPEKGKQRQRLRAAAALAAYDAENPRWVETSVLVDNDLVVENPVFLSPWSAAFRPVKKRLLPRLSEIFRNRQSERTAERSFATNLLADYAADQPQVLADLVMDSDEKQFAVMYAKLKELGEDGLPFLQSEVDKQPMPKDSEEALEALAMRQANAAVALFKMNRPEKVWPLLKHTPDPRVRSYLIHHLAPLGADVMTLVRRLGEEPDVSSRRALILCLGEFDTFEIPVAELPPLIAKLLDLYRTDPDPGLHAAAEWLLRQEGWDQKEELATIDTQLKGDEKQLQARKATDKRQWYVNTEGQTFVILNADKPFRMGSPEGEPDRQPTETPHQWRIGRTYAIASKVVTKAQFRHFQRANPDVEKYNIDQFSRTDDSPQVCVDWYEAVRYCNWLSQKEGIPEKQWCYEPNAQGKYAAGMKPATDYLRRGGYRLPTEAEWEYACRSGSQTSRYYGLSVKLLAKYAWFFDNSDNRPSPVGMKKPNDYGLFDMLGNVWQCCNNRSDYFVLGTGGLLPDYYVVGGGGLNRFLNKSALEDRGDPSKVGDKDCRVVRGGSFQCQASDVRSAYRAGFHPALRNGSSGFRVARTLP